MVRLRCLRVVLGAVHPAVIQHYTARAGVHGRTVGLLDLRHKPVSCSTPTPCGVVACSVVAPAGLAGSVQLGDQELRARAGVTALWLSLPCCPLFAMQRGSRDGMLTQPVRTVLQCYLDFPSSLAGSRKS